MTYLDTNVIISFIDELDPNHIRARKLLEGLKGVKVVTKLSLVELASVYSRASLEKPLALALYSIRKVGARLIDIDFNGVLLQAFRFAPMLKLWTLDLLHIAACKISGAKLFATFDKDIIAKAEDLRKIGIEVITSM